MFFATYKTSLKTLIRSSLLVLVILIGFIITMNSAISPNKSVAIIQNGQLVGEILDTDSEFVLQYDMYINQMLNTIRAWLMLYVVPILCVVSSVVILNRDYGDLFFEVEKSNGISPANHLLGRYLATITVDIVVCLIFMFVSFNYYYFSRGGVYELQLWEYVCDHIIRLLRLFITSALPGILFFCSFTFLAGNMFNSGLISGIFGFSLVLWEYCSVTNLKIRLPNVYHNYFSTKSPMPYHFWTYYNTKWFNEKTVHNPYNENQILLWSSIILTCAFTCFFISYLYTRKRDT